MARRTATLWTSGIATVIGLWAIVAPFAWSFPETAARVTVTAGAIVAVLCEYGLYVATDGASAIAGEPTACGPSPTATDSLS